MRYRSDLLRTLRGMHRGHCVMRRIANAESREIERRLRQARRQLAEITGYSPAEIEFSGSLDHLYAMIGHTRFYLNGAITKNHYLVYTCCPICGDRCRLLRPPRLPERDLSTIAETLELQEMAHGVSHVVTGWRQGYEKL